jgi:hypothetical protein
MTDNQAWKIADVAYNLCYKCGIGIFPGIETNNLIEQLLSVSQSVRDYFQVMLDERNENTTAKDYYDYWFGEND